MAVNYGQLFSRRTFLTKLVEFILSLVCTAIYYDLTIYIVFSGKGAIPYGTFLGFLFINTAFLLGMIIGEEVPKKVTLFLLLVGAIFYITSGAVIVEFWRNINGSNSITDKMIATAIIAFVNAVVFLVDSFLTYSE